MKLLGNTGLTKLVELINNKFATKTELTDSFKSNTRTVEFISGTQTAKTGSWTGVTTDTALYNGKTIFYYLPYAPNGNASLNLTLADGTTTGDKACYLSASRLTTHYSAGSVIPLTYIESSDTWRCADYWNSNTYDRNIFNVAVKAAAAITADTVVVGTSAGYKTAASGITFDITYPILWADTAISSGSTRTDLYTDISAVNLATTKSGWTGTQYAVAYLVGTLSGVTFTIDSAVFTTTAPTSADGKVYTPLGVMYNTTNCRFFPTNKYYQYTNGSFHELDMTTAATGSSNGTIKINGTDISVKGLGSAAYTASTAYAAASHGNHVPTTETANNARFLRNDNTWQTVTPANIGAAASSHPHNYAGSASAGGPATSVAREAGTTNTARHVWFSHADTPGKLVYDNDFKYNPSTNVLTVGSISGKAASADKINTNAGSATQPVYFSSGVPVATTYTLEKSVPSNAVFTDTNNAVTNTLGTTTKFYVTGTTSATTTTGGQYFDTGVYVSTTAGELVATKFTGALNGNANTASKINTSAKIGDTNKPVYIAADGTVTAISYTIDKSVPSNAVFTDTNNAVTNTLGTTTKFYVTGTTSSTTATGGQYFDTGVYVSTTAGELVATKFTGALNGNAATASKLGTSTVGGTTTPIYLNGGTPTALSYTIAKSVPSDAVFTDTNTKVNVVLNTQKKAYLLGTETTPTSSTQAVTAIGDTGVYLTTTAGQIGCTSILLSSGIEIY